VLLPKAVLGNFATVRKNAKAVLKKVQNETPWIEAVNAFGLVDYNDESFPISLQNEDDKSETMYYFNAFFEALDSLFTRTIEHSKNSKYSEADFQKQIRFENEIFTSCLGQPWGGIALALPFPTAFWGFKTRMWMPENSDTFIIEQYNEHSRMRLFLQKLVDDWEAITAIGKNYLGQPYTRKFFWDAGSQPKTALVCLGVSSDRLDEVFGSIYEQGSVAEKTEVPKSVFAEIVAEALESSKDYPEISLSQIPE
jgi:hypothetical protein